MNAPAPSEIMPITNITEVANFLKAGSARARNTAHACVCATLVIGVAIMSLFLVSGRPAEDKLAAARAFVQEVSRQYNEVLKSVTDPAQRELVLRGLRDANEFMVTKLGDASRQNSVVEELVVNLTSSIVRVGAVLIALFLIQIMVGFARYYYKLAEHLTMSAALIILTSGKANELKLMAPLLLPSTIDFGKPPTPTIEKALDGILGTIKELAKKIPTK